VSRLSTFGQTRLGRRPHLSGSCLDREPRPGGKSTDSLTTVLLSAALVLRAIVELPEPSGERSPLAFGGQRRGLPLLARLSPGRLRARRSEPSWRLRAPTSPLRFSLVSKEPSKPRTLRSCACCASPRRFLRNAARRDARRARGDAQGRRRRAALGRGDAAIIGPTSSTTTHVRPDDSKASTIPSRLVGPLGIV